MDSNTGQSSGGHTGIRIGNKVYHYQYFPDDVFHLVRESYDDFAFNYNVLSNRTSVLTRLKLTSKEISVLESELNRLYLVQFRHLQNWEFLKRETKLLEELNSPEKKIGLRATAYFEANKTSPISGNLKSELARSLGKGYMEKLESELNESLLTENNLLDRMEFSPLPETIRKDRFPFLKPGTFLPLRDSLEGILFCKILREEWGLDNTFIISNIQESLSSKEEELFRDFFRAQTGQLIGILSERDPGWAYAALVVLGRLHAIEESLRIGSPVFLSSFPEDAPIVFKKNEDDENNLNRLSEESWAVVSLARKKISSLEELSEKEYQIWEDATNRAFELETGIGTAIPVRVAVGKLVPQREKKFLIPMYFPDEGTIALRLELSKKREQEYHKILKNLYPFHLLYENCTTEILKNVQDSFDRGEIPFPGERIDFPFSLSLIPFYASYAVTKKWNNEGETTALSFRKKKLSELKRKDPGFWTSLREISPLTSSFYKKNREDHFFPLYTDDVFWLRPVYGTINLGAGIGATAIGIFSAPLDRGEKFQKGFQSAFFSLPELVFFNIRKGTFPYVSVLDLPEELFLFRDEE
ncbi:hypothetical protein EHQ12_03825 [Leptospira gomenensis]|uniref:DUF4105 domain-containing protein n=1 Tax=Leptospira gomenensis TaxID=2484974 RepID=A0A5F1Y8L0_9LEPT|nr:hypothetical protein [Leptospira gomenensis]TGK31712.1 hypothetical protein EHQ17_13080 [Leptospira gomenensis]TGK41659.1 hypothetical protein EHQ07_16390 [Leptospira gomenensis]TGK43387.1 hypothetical protein EHQ12_03825 [Leptospira gomenensis]TGK61381.1 hypothetical protein EHQ13_08475 [Leptospira gomenensis]